MSSMPKPISFFSRKNSTISRSKKRPSMQELYHIIYYSQEWSCTIQVGINYRFGDWWISTNIPICWSNTRANALGCGISRRISQTRSFILATYRNGNIFSPCRVLSSKYWLHATSRTTRQTILLCNDHRPSSIPDNMHSHRIPNGTGPNWNP
jgi:hypothetical protein